MLFILDLSCVLSPHGAHWSGRPCGLFVPCPLAGDSDARFLGTGHAVDVEMWLWKEQLLCIMDIKRVSQGLRGHGTQLPAGA